MEEKKKNRIGFGMIIVLIVSAGIVDIVNIIPIIGGFTTTAYWAAISWYLWKTGHGLFNWKIVIPEIASVVLEWIPYLSFTPSVVVATIGIIFISKFEDKTGISLMPIAAIKKMTLPRRSPPLNANPGIREPRSQNNFPQEN